MKRPKKPDFLMQWHEWRLQGPPKCCHNCEYYGSEGHCHKYDMRPPDEFAGTQDACNDWMLEIPF